MQGSMFSAESGLKDALLKEIQAIDHRMRRDRETIATASARMKADEESRKLTVTFLEKLGAKAPESTAPKIEKKPRVQTGSFIKTFMEKNPGIGYSVD